MARTRHRGWALAAAAVLAATGTGCNRLRGNPTGREGWLGYRVGALGFDLPADWAATGDASRIEARSSDGRAKLEAKALERLFANDRECLAQGEQSLARGASELERSRQHPTRIGGRAAVVLEADRGAWHGWAWAACDARRQYRLFFVGVSPMAPDASAAQRGIEGSIRFDDAR